MGMQPMLGQQGMNVGILMADARMNGDVYKRQPFTIAFRLQTPFWCFFWIILWPGSRPNGAGKDGWP